MYVEKHSIKYIHANPRETKSGRGVWEFFSFKRMQNGAFCCILDIKL